LKDEHISEKSQRNKYRAIAIDHCEEIKKSISEFLRENKSIPNFNVRKITSISYLIICENKNEADKILTYNCKFFKHRPLNESSKEIK